MFYKEVTNTGEAHILKYKRMAHNIGDAETKRKEKVAQQEKATKRFYVINKC